MNSIMIIDSRLAAADRIRILGIREMQRKGE